MFPILKLIRNHLMENPRMYVSLALHCYTSRYKSFHLLESSRHCVAVVVDQRLIVMMQYVIGPTRLYRQFLRIGKRQLAAYFYKFLPSRALPKK